jgi:hypothetical protein
MYLDPGFGGMLLQGVVLITAVGGAIVFSLRKKIRNFFKKDKDEEQPTLFEEHEDDAIDMLDDDAS